MADSHKLLSSVNTTLSERCPTALVCRRPIPDWHEVHPRIRRQAAAWGHFPGSYNRLRRPRPGAWNSQRQSPAQALKTPLWTYGAFFAEGDEDIKRVAQRAWGEDVLQTHRYREAPARSRTHWGPYNAFDYYLPGDKTRSVYMELASVLLDDPDDVVRFANVYGLPRMHMPASEWLPYPLLAFAFDVSKMREMCRLAFGILCNDTAAVADACVSLHVLVGDDPASIRLLGEEPDTRYDSPPEFLAAGRLPTMEEAVYYLGDSLQDLIHPSSVFLNATFSGDGRRVLSLQPRYPSDTLVSACHLMLYWDVTAGRHVAKCDNPLCSRFYYATRAGRSYCSPACQNRAAVRRHYWSATEKGRREKARRGGTGARRASKPQQDLPPPAVK